MMCTKQTEDRPEKLWKNILLLHDNTRPHTAYLTKAALATMGWKIMNHPSYGPDFTPGEFHLFGPM
jgi:hypothetical protein